MSYLKLLPLLLIAVLQARPVRAQQQVSEPLNTNPQWSQPYPPFRIVGNVYYVGTYDLACYLITTPNGNILINTALAGSASIIKANIKSLGFKTADIKVLMTTQAHYDHVGAMAEIRKQTGAKLIADEKDASVLADGGVTDYAFSTGAPSFLPVKPDLSVGDGNVTELGDVRITLLHHPGHTKGSCSYLFDVTDQGKTYKVLIANMPTIVTDKRLTDIPAYPDIAKDYAYTFDALKKIPFDLWLSSHASQFSLHAKHKPGDAYRPEAFRDKEGFDKALADLEAAYRKKLEQK
jgi:metallo-beta-lactamase class B